MSAGWTCCVADFEEPEQPPAEDVIDGEFTQPAPDEPAAEEVSDFPGDTCLVCGGGTVIVQHADDTREPCRACQRKGWVPAFPERLRLAREPATAASAA